MSSAPASLSEPHVLAHTKRRLFPEADAPGTYAVVDTQFATDRWLETEPIAESVRETLAPFNRVDLGGGYPDLVGVGRLESDLLAVDRLGKTPPLVAVEAKGYTAGGGVDTHRGIVQAYERLHEANAVYLAAPLEAISQTDRTLARELNVGVLGVSAAGQVSALETPRVVGARSTTDANAIRFQASAQGVTDQSFGLNHPKNYLGYPLAHVLEEPTADALAAYRVVGAVDEARRGAAFLGLVAETSTGPELTPLGREVVRFGVRHHGSARAALETFADWYRSRKRFVELAPAWGELARRVVFAYPATELLVGELEALHADGVAEPTLVDLVEYLHVLHPTFTIELFVRGTEAARRRALDTNGDLRREALADGEIYHSPTVFQLKAMLYHAGILTDRGAEPHRLEPAEDVWALRERV
ncbi:hypothetical protein [Natrononativus amylolyticus]|uniref:hypothetical protein n=1 Tax=Natrononativus amylolyticus TaxID=2963434 RepID=UPI0020CD30A4|nr:hypothetical protein [Natrononativus amylolyticus]